MKNFLWLFLIIFSCSQNNRSSSKLLFEKFKSPTNPSAPIKYKDVIELSCKPIDTVRVGFIGVGKRGSSAVYRFSFLDKVKIMALCDLRPENIEYCNQILQKKNIPRPDVYTNENDWKEICERDDIDLIYVSTHWDLHTEIAVYAMDQGKHVAVEVPAALNIDECWQLVRAAERNRKHCFPLENCNYGYFEMSAINMCKHHVLGEIIHCDAAYIHDLRRFLFDEKFYWKKWRIKHLKKAKGNTYPTHGIGPVSHILNIHRGDRFSHIVSMSSKQFGLSEYAKNINDNNFNCEKGDVNTSIIKTINGKTIMLQHNVSTPRPYSRIFSITGSKGHIQKYPEKCIAVEPNPHEYLNPFKLDSIVNEYYPPLLRKIRPKAEKVGGHGGIDFIMDYRLIYCLNKGLPLDQDVYDAAEWSSIIELSRNSVSENSIVVEFPDFTSGAWNRINKLTYYKD